ncbi:MAG: hypothetical protein ACRDEA_07620, partial [Microcystaceae cyanobacterium]
MGREGQTFSAAIKQGRTLPMTTYTPQSIPHSLSPTEKLEQLQTQLTHLKESPRPTKYEDQQKLNK